MMQFYVIYDTTNDESVTMINVPFLLTNDSSLVINCKMLTLLKYLTRI